MRVLTLHTIVVNISTSNHIHLSQLFNLLTYICFIFPKELCSDPTFFSLEQVQQGRNNKPIWIQIVSQFTKPLIYYFEKNVMPGKTNFEEYCPIAAEALMFLLLENNYTPWKAEYGRKDKSKEEKK